MSMMNERIMNTKKLLILALATTLGITPLVGCSDNFEYTIESDGNINVEGLISYDRVKNLKLIHLTNEIALLDEYILVDEIKTYRPYQHYYENIETGKKVYIENVDDFKNFKVEVVIDHIVDYLYKYDMVKEEYSIEDIIKLKELLLSDEKLNIMAEESSINILKRKRVK